MPLEFREEAGGEVVVLRAIGTLEQWDYRRFVPELDRLLRNRASVGLMLVLEPGFRGWASGTAWESVKLALKHFTHVERLALVGEARRTGRLRRWCRLFSAAEVRCFEPGQTDEAGAWLREPRQDPAATA